MQFELTVTEPHTRRSDAITPYIDATTANSTIGKAGDDVVISLIYAPNKSRFTLDCGTQNNNAISIFKIKYAKFANADIYPIIDPPVFKSEQQKNDLMRAIFFFQKIILFFFVIFYVYQAHASDIKHRRKEFTTFYYLMIIKIPNSFVCLLQRYFFRLLLFFLLFLFFLKHN